VLYRGEPESIPPPIVLLVVVENENNKNKTRMSPVLTSGNISRTWVLSGKGNTGEGRIFHLLPTRAMGNSSLSTPRASFIDALFARVAQCKIISVNLCFFFIYCYTKQPEHSPIGLVVGGDTDGPERIEEESAAAADPRGDGNRMVSYKSLR